MVCFALCIEDDWPSKPFFNWHHKTSLYKTLQFRPKLCLFARPNMGAIHPISPNIAQVIYHNSSHAADVPWSRNAQGRNGGVQHQWWCPAWSAWWFVEGGLVAHQPLVHFSADCPNWLFSKGGSRSVAFFAWKMMNKQLGECFHKWGIPKMDVYHGKCYEHGWFRGTPHFRKRPFGFGGIFHLERTHLASMGYVFGWCPIEGLMQNATNITPGCSSPRSSNRLL